jgi:hypothetical protein
LPTLLDHVYAHPLGLEVGLEPILALISFATVDGDINELKRNYLIESLKGLKDFMRFESDSVANTDTDTDTNKVVTEVIREIKGQQNKRNDCLSLLKEVAANPMQTSLSETECLFHCWRHLGSFLDDKPHKERESAVGVTRMRLQGNHTKEYLLRAAVTCISVTILDLQDCTSLDEEILDAMTICCSVARVLLLKGTSISPDSDVVAKLKARGCDVDFSGTCCPCCGRVQFCRVSHEPAETNVYPTNKA